ncbi:PAS domain-containing sensor histidine kinase [Catalinimonas niigatensis]|uniref:PAS domain-containing sensor histidine kinase n=1 Tax=Catalinimonas niigatensis TaxID=1397264 RepID=UPI0026651DD5|nr:PAS domain-containing sensor histidine kinase [Catalinimonas niigatensis]WPP51748.1 PAS domain-containing sensor histidine kinase [Catalinimonas niigatensis]
MDTTLLQDEIEEMANIGSYEVDIASNTWHGSRNFIKIFGLPLKDQYTLEEFQALVHPEDFPKVMQEYRHSLLHNEDFNCDYRCIKPDGQVIYVHSRSKVIRSTDNLPLKVIGIKQDITELKLQALQLERLNELNRQKSEVLAHVAHDLKSPLNGIEGLISILNTNQETEQSKLWDLMENACIYASELVSDLIEMSEIESITKDIPKQMLNINELLQIAIERLEVMADKKKIKVQTSLSDDALVPVNRVKMIRAFTNLLSNAIKFSHAQQKIQIKTRRYNQFLHICIQDEGIGMHANEVKQLFQRFSPVSHKGTSGEKSTGLGLYIVKQIIDLHGGKVYVESEIKKGSAFHIYLPLS